MKTMKDFAAQQLTKKQMNQVKGGIKHSFDSVDNCGVLYYCPWEDGQNYVCEKVNGGRDLQYMRDRGIECVEV